jgi:hypothetical protein
LKLWRESEPEAPDGLWYKDFGSFKICGEGKYPEDLPARGTTGKGEEALKELQHLASTCPVTTCASNGSGTSP